MILKLHNTGFLNYSELLIVGNPVIMNASRELRILKIINIENCWRKIYENRKSFTCKKLKTNQLNHLKNLINLILLRRSVF